MNPFSISSLLRAGDASNLRLPIAAKLHPPALLPVAQRHTPPSPPAAAAAARLAARSLARGAPRLIVSAGARPLRLALLLLRRRSVEPPSSNLRRRDDGTLEPRE